MGLEEEAVVVSVDGDEAKVRIKPSGACASCPSSSICGSEGDEKVTVAVNPVGARPGDTVRVVMHAQMYLKGTMLVYGLPVVMLIVGGIAGKEWAVRFRPGWDADVVAASLGFALMALSFLAVRLWSRKIEKSGEYLPVIEKVLGSAVCVVPVDTARKTGAGKER